MVMKVSSYELFPGLSDAASKHAVQAFFDCLRAEVEEYGISVSTISHSFIHSPAPAEESPAPDVEGLPADLLLHPLVDEVGIGGHALLRGTAFRVAPT